MTQDGTGAALSAPSMHHLQLNTTKYCVLALESMKSNLMALSASSTTDISSFAMTADTGGFSADIGNFDLCQRQQGLQHCLAGTVQKGLTHEFLPPSSGLCVPNSCGPMELQQPEIRQYLDFRIVELLRDTQLADVASSPLLANGGQQTFNYFVKLRNIMEITESANAGYTCGDHRATMTPDRWLFMAAFIILLLVVLGSTIYQMISEYDFIDGGFTTGMTEDRDESMTEDDGSSIEMKTMSNSWESVRPSSREKKTPAEMSLGEKMVDAFSLIKNIPYVFQSNKQPTNITANASMYRSLSQGNVETTVQNELGFDERRPTSASQHEDRFAFLDGFRAISMIWIILGHTLTASSLNGIMNPAVLLPPTGMLTSMPAQIFLSSRFAVETFFFISGFLVTESILKRLWLPPDAIVPNTSSIAADIIPTTSSTASLALETGDVGFGLGEVMDNSLGSYDADSVSTYGAIANNDNNSNESITKKPQLHQWLPMYYIHRILRIMPPYLFCLIVWWKIGVMMGNGPFWMKWEQFAHRCDLYWLTNLSFINNLWPYDSSETDQCMYVTWYLANDMQFYFVAPAFLIAYLQSRPFGILLTTFAVALSCVCGYYWSIQTGGSAHSFDGAQVTIYSHLFYTKPQFRFPAYGIGILTGMVRRWLKDDHPTWQLSRGWAQLWMATGCSILLYLIFYASLSAYQNRPCGYTELTGATCGSGWSIEGLAIYNSMSQPLWAGACAIITLLSANNQGFLINRFLSHQIWAAVSDED